MNDMTEHLSTILVDKYGPFLTINQLAEVLDRSPSGLRISLQQDSDIARQLKSARKRVGRRLYFNALIVAEIMSNENEDPRKH